MENTSDTQSEEQALRELYDSLDSPAHNDEKQAPHPAVAAGIGCFIVLNVSVLMSLPPVLMGRGAPYLPTYASKMDKMFLPLKKHFRSLGTATNSNKRLVFMDLGSGDGRVVFRAAREGLFTKSVGYEINPLLHLFAQARRVIQAPRYLSTTEFHLKDLWKVDLSGADAVAVYGLDPIMKDLGNKMKKELRPGSVVLSNVFAIPGWKPSTLSRDGMHIYTVPSCWKDKKNRF